MSTAAQKLKKAAYYVANRERVLAAVKQYAAANPEKAKANVRRWHAVNKEYVTQYDRARYAADPAKYKARNARNYRAHPHRTRVNAMVYEAVKAGLLVRLPCWVCDKAKTEAHHANYDAPFDVVWLCRSHHRQLHAEVQPC